MVDCSEPTTCSICLESIDESLPAKYKCSLRCGHSYHPTCIMHWFQRQTTCPTCRRQHRNCGDPDVLDVPDATLPESSPARLIVSSMWTRTLEDDDVDNVRRLVIGRRNSTIEHPVLARSFRQRHMLAERAPRNLIDQLSSLTPTSTHRVSVDATPAPPLVSLPMSLASSSYAMRQRTSILSDLLGFGTRSRVAASLVRERL